jgi:hypothetical protein
MARERPLPTGDNKMKSQILKAKNAKGGSMKSYTIADYNNWNSRKRNHA